ncbi:heterogeneous nuclear ribonucleoprotein K homolog, partial [Homalodisca vitripennis]|uniref:heterogeneous nuclear ribonucleoprotein K homolog n=1 Tax=Homalodisca vitripennis TaxID=197043 RepID=UPI001EEAC83B
MKLCPTLRIPVDAARQVMMWNIRMLVHQSQAGCIIGKGGLKVKELREKTGARIKIYTNCCPDSTDRVVQITGRGNNLHRLYSGDGGTSQD